jgi:1,4-dihydroxy-2-naphthoate octaprenyltransferase
MGGPKPIAYTPLGELTVFVFFGLVAVMGTQWLVTGQVSLLGGLASVCIGCLSAAALAVNNHRDRVHDQSMGRKTLVVCFGERASAALFGLLLCVPFMVCPLMAWAGSTPLFLLPLLLALPTAKVCRDFRKCKPGLAYNAILFRVFRLEMWFALTLSGAAVLSRQGHGMPLLAA